MSAWELPAPARASKATYMLAVGAPSDQLESHIDLIESAELNVVAIEDPSSAAAHGCQHRAGPATGMTAVIDLGWEAAALTVIRENTVIYTRKLGEGGLARLHQAALEAASGELEIVEHEIWRVGFAASGQPDLHNTELLDVLESHVAAMLREIVRAFGYTAHQYPEAAVSKAVLIGGGAVIPGIAERFQSESGVTTSAGLDGHNAGADQAIAAPMISALGLALWRKEAR